MHFNWTNLTLLMTLLTLTLPLPLPLGVFIAIGFITHALSSYSTFAFCSEKLFLVLLLSDCRINVLQFRRTKRIVSSYVCDFIKTTVTKSNHRSEKSRGFLPHNLNVCLS